MDQKLQTIKVWQKTALKASEFLFVEKLFKKFASAEIYLVGGAVRDLLIGKSTKDYDFVVKGVPAKDLEKFLGAEGEVDHLIKAIKRKQPEEFLYTIEFFPEEGKYHIDGHATCAYSCLPAESKKNKNLCPHCGKPLILGVLHRVQELADRTEVKNDNFIPFKSIIPLQEIIADYLSVGKAAKKVQALYLDLVRQYPEFEILIDLDKQQLEAIMDIELAELIMKVRLGEVEIKSGYDGIFGQVKIKMKDQPQQTKII